MLLSGIICVILGVIITLFDLRFPSMIATFFSADVLQDADEVVHEGKHFYQTFPFLPLISKICK